MAGRQKLEVWLHHRHVATLEEPSSFRYRLSFTTQALDHYGEGARVLSLSLPMSSEPVTDHLRDPTRRPVAAFLEGLLPEGNLRTQVAGRLGVATIDKMALLRQVGAECAGAVQFLAPGHTPTSGTVEPLAPGEVVDIVEALPTYALPEGMGLQASLAGIQDKVLLARMADGGWGWPQDGAVSTHLIKPEPAEGAALAHLVQVEHWALEVAARAGLSAASTTLETFGTREAIVVTRYDRTPTGARLHQEDFCQALGLDPQAKYEAVSGNGRRESRLRRIATLAGPRSTSPDELRRTLLSMVTFNLLIGNGDAHSKNYALLLRDNGEVSLAPLYDVAPVRYLAARFRNTGHLINGRSTIDRVDLDDLVAEARSWGTDRHRAQRVVDDVVEATWEAVHAVGLSDGTDHVLANLEDLWASREWRAAR